MNSYHKLLYEEQFDQQEKHEGERVHLADKKLDMDKIYSVAQDSFAMPKPNGLWYAIGDQWVEFIKHFGGIEAFRNKYNFAYIVNIDHTEIYKLSNPGKIRKFNEKYGDKEKSDWGEVTDAVHWRRVAEDWKGVELNPYNSKVGKHSEDEIIWMRTWDIASGCIWDTEAIRNIELIYSDLQDKKQ